MKVEIDPRSGFCGGVIRTITQAETFLSETGRLYSLGAPVHNEEELSRLKKLGLVTVEKTSLPRPEKGNDTILIRAHGEPPEVYRQLEESGFNIIDCTCPVVLKLQKDIKEACGKHSQIVIFGKIGHPEVLGLVGQADCGDGAAVVVENTKQLTELLKSGVIRSDVPTEIFSQTTKSPSGYEEVCAALSAAMKDRLTVHNTICTQVAQRHKLLSEFAASHDAVVFVAGRESSNGKVLCDLCRQNNPRTWHISGPSEIESCWFRKEDNIGVCGATSTPKWLLEEVAATIENLHKLR